MSDAIDIAAICLGERHRKEMGDLDRLARSIADVGLLQPIVITPDGRLIAGERRLRACRLLNWTRFRRMSSTSQRSCAASWPRILSAKFPAERDRCDLPGA